MSDREKQRERIAAMRRKLRAMQMELAQKDQISIDNLEQLIAIQRDRDRFLRFARLVAEAKTKDLFQLQRYAQRMVESE